MRNLRALVFVSILFLASTCVTAQQIELIQELKEWEPLLGRWNYEVELRTSPTSDWRKASTSLDIRSGGFFVEIRHTREMGGEKRSGIEIVGYDPVKKTQVSTRFNSLGTWGNVTSMGWSGRTRTINITAYTGEREVVIVRATWEYSSDFKSGTRTMEKFSDGKWWISSKVKSTKIE